MNLSVISNRTKGKAIVVGSGIAGLSAALRLAHEGFSVSVLEQHSAPGGKMRSIASSAGPVDAGPTVLTMRPIFEDLFRSVGERLEDHVTLVRQKILARHWWPDGSTLDLFDDYETSQQEIYKFAGLVGFREFQTFFQKTSRLFEAFNEPMMQNSAPSPFHAARVVAKQPSLIKDLAPLQSLASSLKSHFTDPRLSQLFGRYATYVGGSPYSSPALLSLIWQAEAKGVWTVQGGMHFLARTLKKLAESRGAQFSFNTLVHRLLVTDNKISGVQLDNGENLQADIVVFNGDPRALAMGKLGPEFIQVATESKTDERSLSARVWSFASQVQGLDLVHHNVFFAKNPVEEFDAIKAGRMPTDPTIYVCAQDRGLNAAYPKNERFEIILNAAPLTTAEPLEKEFEKCQTITLKTLDQFGLKFSLAPSKSSLTTPHHFANLFPASEGSLYGQSPHGMIAAFRRPKSKTVIPGLYLAGGGAHPGAGIPMATLSARHAVEEILNDQISTSQFHQTGTHGGISMA